MTRQVRTSGTTTQAIMRRAGFVAGVEDVRSGRAPNYDGQDDYWSYERRRLWACVAPSSMPLMIDGKLNPKAIALCNAAFKRGYIR